MGSPRLTWEEVGRTLSDTHLAYKARWTGLKERGHVAHGEKSSAGSLSVRRGEEATTWILRGFFFSGQIMCSYLETIPGGDCCA
jgi:hypothetical protein